MADGKNDVRLQVFVSKDTVDRIDELAKSVGWSRNEMTSFLLLMGTSDVEWVANKAAMWLRSKLRGKGS